MSTGPKHGTQATGDMSWLASINATPPQTGRRAPAQPAWPVGGRITVVTRPSIPRVAIGVYLGLLLFAATGAGVAFLVAGVLADTVVLAP